MVENLGLIFVFDALVWSLKYGFESRFGFNFLNLGLNLIFGF